MVEGKTPAEVLRILVKWFAFPPNSAYYGYSASRLAPNGAQTLRLCQMRTFQILMVSSKFFTSNQRMKLALHAIFGVAVGMLDLLGAIFLAKFVFVILGNLSNPIIDSISTNVLFWVPVSTTTPVYLSYVGSICAVLLLMKFVLGTVNQRKLTRFLAKIAASRSTQLLEFSIQEASSTFQKNEEGIRGQTLILGIRSLLMEIVALSLALFAEITLILFFVTFGLIVNWEATVFVIVFLLVALLILNRLRFISASHHEHNRAILEIERRQILHDIQETSEELRAFRSSELYLNKFHLKTENEFQEISKLQLLQLIPRYALEFLFVLLLLIPTVWSAFNSDGSILPDLGFFAVLGTRVMPTILRIQSLLQQMIAARTNSEISIDTFTKHFQINKLNSRSSHLSMHDREFSHSDQIPKEITSEFGDLTLEFNSVSFSYDENESDIVSNLSFIASPKSLTLISGDSGKGKTTILKMAAGLVSPTKGTVTLSGTTSTTSPNSLSMPIAYVPQVPKFPSARLKDYFGLAKNGRIIEQEIWDSLLEVDLHDFIKFQFGGLEVPFSEKSPSMSVGQKQRLALARALYSSSSFLLLDEPTSALDNSSEDIILELLRRIKSTKTILLISHEKRFEAIADQIIFLN
jgi:ABC-type multidrug transport system fused ATPase/permease subunit